MARLASALTIWLSLPIALATGLAMPRTAGAAGAEKEAVTIEPEVASPQAVEAYRHYWNAFDAYEKRLERDGRAKYQKAWTNLKAGFEREQKKLSAEELTALQKAAADYRADLEQHPDAENAVYVKLNLAQVLRLLADHTSQPYYYDEALTVLQDLDAVATPPAQREEALYLQALTLEALRRKDEALVVWRRLADEAHATVYGMHAWVALGDHYFGKDDAKEAAEAYQHALELVGSLDTTATPAGFDISYEQIRIRYRLSWAAYRAADLQLVISTALGLLQPGIHVNSVEQRQKMQDDAVGLIGDALYEQNLFTTTQNVLRRRALLDFSPAIGLHLMRRHAANGIHIEVVRNGEFFVKEFPAAKELPEWLSMLAASYEALGRNRERISALERLALLLPAQSLWRTRYEADFAAVKAMEDKARGAAQTVADFYYEQALGSGNPETYLTAASYYDMLTDAVPNGTLSIHWRLRAAHCYYLADHLDEAAGRYAAIKADYKVSPDALGIAAYQLVLTKEKLWRQTYAKAVAAGNDPVSDKDTLKSLDELERSIDEFANRFPDDPHTIDLALVGASANRDQTRLDHASRYWQRVLIASAKPVQRTIAIRGIVYVTLQTGSKADVVATVRRYLELEDFKSLGAAFANELHGILVAAALDQSQWLSKEGRVKEAGELLVGLAREFRDLRPADRARLFRDGAYSLAIAGAWAAAEDAVEDYDKADLVDADGDMVYLRARAEEYQIRFDEASKAFLELAKNHPGHPRSLVSLNQAESLAEAEDDFGDAAEAASLLATRTSDRNMKLAAYSRAYDYEAKAGNAKEALRLAELRLKASRSTEETLRSQLLMAKARFKAGDGTAQKAALAQLERISRTARNRHDQMSEEGFREIAGESNFLLGEEERRRFDDFGLFERGGSMVEKIHLKEQMFVTLGKRYQAAAEAGDPTWGARARFRFAEAAEALADELASVPLRTSASPTLSERLETTSEVSSYRQLARELYGQNVMAAQGDPSRYRDNEWVKKSRTRLVAFGGVAVAPAHRDQVPPAVPLELPYQWSL